MEAPGATAPDASRMLANAPTSIATAVLDPRNGYHGLSPVADSFESILVTQSGSSNTRHQCPAGSNLWEICLQDTKA